MIGNAFTATRKALFGYMMLLAFLVTVEYSYYRFAPVSMFANYDSVQIVGEAVEGRPIEFISNSFHRAGIRNVWDDILQCKLPDRERFSAYSMQPFERIFEYNVYSGDQRDTWFYSKSVPVAGSVCRLQYGPSLVMPYGIIRHHPTKFTETFIIQSAK